jgi:cellulose 1,4-beta-cellobiosidase
MAGTTGANGGAGTAGAGGVSATGAGGATKLTVKLKNPDLTASPQYISLALQVTNNDTTAVSLSDLTLRYWYTYDVTAPATAVVAQSSMCNYAQTPPGACGNVISSTASGTPPSGPWVPISPARTNADFYYQLGFAAAAGSLSPSATAEFQVEFHKNDFTTYTQANDYSYNGSMSVFATTTKVTVYRQGTLVYGEEPPP